MHLFQRGQQFGSCWRSLKSSLSAPVLNPCWNTVLNLSMLIKHLLIEVFLCKTKWVVIATLHVSGMWAEPQTGQIQQYLSPIRNEWVAAQKPGILTHTHTDVILNFFVFLSPDVLATTRKQNTALDSAYGQWTSLYFHLTASADLAGHHWALTE